MIKTSAKDKMVSMMPDENEKNFARRIFIQARKDIDLREKTKKKAV